MLPLVRELEKRPETESVVCVTAQHRQLLDCVLRCFELEPDYDLDIMTEGQSLYSVTAKVLTGMEGCLAQAKPDLVLVHGDTATALAAALAAFYAKIPVGHVEAGLRTFDLQSPFPEEADRCLISRLAALNFAPTEANAENLRRERVPGEIFVTGNTVIDAMRMPSKRTAFRSPELAQLDFSRRIVTLTCHRRENYGETMESIFSAVKELAERHGDITVIYLVQCARGAQCGEKNSRQHAKCEAHRAVGRIGYASAAFPQLFCHDRLRRPAGGGSGAGQARFASAP